MRQSEIEENAISNFAKSLFSFVSDLRGRRFLCSRMEGKFLHRKYSSISTKITLNSTQLGPPPSPAQQHDPRIPAVARRMAPSHLAARFLLQKRQKGHLSNDDHPQSLLMVVPRQDYPLHGQVSTKTSSFNQNLSHALEKAVYGCNYLFKVT